MSNDLWDAYTRGITRLAPRHLPAGTPAVRSPQPQHVGHTLDLHGLTLSDAHAETFAFFTAIRHLYRFVTIVTGSSGMIRQEFRHWIDGHPDVQRCEELGGSFRVYWRKSR